MGGLRIGADHFCNPVEKRGRKWNFIFSFMAQHHRTQPQSSSVLILHLQYNESTGVRRFLNIYLFWAKRKREERQREGGQRTWRRLCTDGLTAASLMWDSNAWTARSWPELKSDAQPNEPPRCPRGPTFFMEGSHMSTAIHLNPCSTQASTEETHQKCLTLMDYKGDHLVLWKSLWGAPRWLSRFSVRLVISAQVIISVQVPQRTLCW